MFGTRAGRTRTMWTSTPTLRTCRVLMPRPQPGRRILRTMLSTPLHPAKAPLPLTPTRPRDLNVECLQTPTLLTPRAKKVTALKPDSLSTPRTDPGWTAQVASLLPFPRNRALLYSMISSRVLPWQIRKALGFTNRLQRRWPVSRAHPVQCPLVLVTTSNVKFLNYTQNAHTHLLPPIRRPRFLRPKSLVMQAIPWAL